MSKSCDRCPCSSTTLVEIKDISTTKTQHYSTRTAFNCDSDCILLYGSGQVTTNDLNANQKQIIPLSFESHFSDNYSNLIWGNRFANGSNSSFGTYDILSGQYTEYFNANSFFGSTGCNITIGDFKGVVQDDKCVVLLVQCGANKTMVSLDLDVPSSSSNVLGMLPFPTSGNWAGFSPNCQYIYVYQDSLSFRIYDPTLSSVVYADTLPGGDVFNQSHMDWGVAENGDNIMGVVFSGSNGFISPVTQSWGEFTGNSAPSATSASHISGLASKKCPGVFFVSEYNDFNAGLNTSSYLINVKPDGSGGYTSELLTDLGNIGSTANSYAETAKGSISPCGEFALFNKPGPVTSLITFDSSACQSTGPVTVDCAQSDWSV